MGFGVLIDTAIGLMLMFLLISLVATAVIESISQFFSLRAKNLKRAIDELLSGQTAPGDKPLAQAFAEHPLTAIASKLGGRNWLFSSSQSSPSYIDRKTFVSTLRSVSAGGAAVASFGAAIDTLPDGDVKKALVALRDNAGQAAGDLEKAVGDWFDSMMERASGVFQRWMRALSIGVGFFLALAINADAIDIGQRLASDSALRSAVVDIAKKQAECTAPVAATSPAPAAPAAAAKPPECANIENLWAKLQTFPVGWTKKVWEELTSGECWTILGKVLYKLLGLLLTGLAVSLGAPFWFDLLSKTLKMRIKSTGENVDEQKKK